MGGGYGESEGITKILADRHHSGLYASLLFTLEGRLGHEVFSPIGTEWFNEGYWRMAEIYNNAVETISQYLGFQQGELQEDGYYKILDPANNIYHRGITLDKFKEIDIDIIICTLPQHIDAYRELIRRFKPNAKLIYQIGNVDWHNIIPWDKVDNILASVKEFKYPAGKHVLFYKQEFDLSIFHPTDSLVKNEIASFVNCLPNHEYFYSLKGVLSPEYKLRSYGQSCPDGIITTTSEMANIMNICKFGYHNKPHGDGYGHVIHNWFAVGKPVIINLSDYTDKLAGELLVDGKTCIDISNARFYELADIIKNISDLQYADMCGAVRDIFKEKVDFKHDAVNMREFLSNLI